MPYSKLRATKLSVVALAALAFQGCNLGARTFEGSFEQTVEVAAPIRLEIASDSGSIRVHGDDTSAITIRGRIRVNSRLLSDFDAQERVRDLEENPPIERDGSTLLVGKMVGQDRLRHASIDYDIVVPHETRMDAKSDSGRQHVEGVAGPVSARADSGSLEILSIDSDVTTRTDSGSQRISSISGRVSAEADSGRIEVRDSGDGIEVRTDSGSINLDTVRGPVNTRADSGSITAEGLAGGFRGEADSGSIRVSQTDPGNLFAKTDSGSVVFETAPNGSYDFEIRTGSGPIRIENQGAHTRLYADRRAEGAIGEGGFEISIQTDSGSATLR